ASCSSHGHSELSFLLLSLHCFLPALWWVPRAPDDEIWALLRKAAWWEASGFEHDTRN
ncbi:tRNA pseudouridine synthase A, partial [Clarias magur]